MSHNTHDAVANRWVSIALGNSGSQLKSRNLHARGDSIFSYGEHFEVGRIIRDAKGKPVMWLLNGDRWRSNDNTTARHQAAVLSAVSYGAALKLPRVTIPFSALLEASIDLDSIRFVHSTPDRNETIHVRTTTFPEGAVWRMIEVTVDYGKRGDITSEGVEYVPIPKPLRADYADLDFDTWYSTVIKPWMEADIADRAAKGVKWGVITPSVTKQEARLYVNSRTSWQTWDVTKLGDGTTVYERDVYRHWLGESLITGQVNVAQRVRCRDCKGTGDGGENGRVITGWSSIQQKVITIQTKNCDTCGGQGTRLVTRRRRSFFLSGFDSNETRPSYFLCELPPKVKPTTIEEAYDTLKPEAVKLAESLGRDVKRQGDIFATPLNVDTRSLTKAGGVRLKADRLFNTNHRATETMTLRDGTVLARGTLTHAPEGRRPDHARVKLGQQWHVIQKNLVPTTVGHNSALRGR